MTMPAAEDDGEEWGELFDARMPRVDAVGTGANGVPRWLIAKQDENAGVLDPSYVRSLISKEADPVPARDDVTVSGSPAAIGQLMRQMHEAPVRKAAPPEMVTKAEIAWPDSPRDVALSKFVYDRLSGSDELSAEGTLVRKAKYSTEDRRQMASSGAAMDDGSYPIKDEDDLDRAIRAVGRGGSSHDAIRRHIISRARSLGASSKIPDNWNSDGSLKGDSVAKTATGPVAKDMGPELGEGVDGMDPTVPLAGPEDDFPGDPTAPGSPAWEAIDAATASKWTSIAARLKNALSVMAERELLEAASADPDDAESAWDLQDAMCAVDYVIQTLACFAAGEQAEAEFGAEEMEAVGKALATFDPAPLEAIEGYAVIAKAGRVLSSANEARIREAAASLQQVLSTLPSAPVAGDIAKEAAMAETTTPDTSAVPSPAAEATPAPETVAKGAEGEQAAGAAPAVTDAANTNPAAVAKADGEPDAKVASMMPVYDADGNLCGVVDPGDVTPLQGVKSKTGGEDKPAEAAPDADDLTPAPAADAGVPADDVTKSEAPAEAGPVAKQDPETSPATTGDAGMREVLKSIVMEALDERGKPEDVAKQADVNAALAEIRKRLETVENHPAAPKVFTNGAVPPQGTLRGQDQAAAGAAPVDVAKALARKQELYAADAPTQRKIADEMTQDAYAVLTAIRGGHSG